MAIALHALLVYTVVAVRRVKHKETEALPILSGGVCGGSPTGGVPDASHDTCRAQCGDSRSCDVYCHGAGGRKGDWACLFFQDDCDSSAPKTWKRWKGYSCYSDRRPAPCDLEKPVFISDADSGLFLTPIFSWFWVLRAVESRLAKTWTLHEAREPASGFYLTDYRGLNLQSHRSDCDEDGHCDEDLKFVGNRHLWETWNFTADGDGTVNIQDFEGNWLVHGNYGGDSQNTFVLYRDWSHLRHRWRITRQDGSPACSFD